MRKKGEHAIGSPDPYKKRADESTQKLNQYKQTAWKL